MVICTVEVNEKAPQTIVIGRRGTYNTQEVVFDIGYLIDAYGVGTAVLAVKRSQDSSAYPAVVAQEDSTVTWTVSETDTYYKGAGECELMWYVDGGLSKTIIYPMVVMRDILSTTEEAPDAYQTWVDDLTTLGAETLQNAQDAAQSASDAESAKDDAVDAKEAAEEAAEKAEAASVHAPIIYGGYWYIWNNGQYVNTGVRAEGQKGDQGDPGVKGDTGNGIASITKTGTSGLVDTYTVTYTDGTTTTFTVTNGAKGDKGDTGATGNGIQSITKTGTSGNVDTYTITYTNGQTTTFTVTNGGVSSVAGKTGEVTLNANDIAFSESDTYDEGTVGAELSDQKNAIDQKAPAIINTASGDIASFADGADGMQIKKIVGTIVPQQAAGTPSPENPLPISGWTGANIIHAAKNLFDVSAYTIKYSKYVDSDGVVKDSQYNCTVEHVPLPSNVTITLAGLQQNANGKTRIAQYDADGNFLQFNEVSANSQKEYKLTITTDSSCAYANISLSRTNTSVEANFAGLQIEVGATATEYESFQGRTLPINWQTEAGTIYGGTVTLNEDGSVDVVASWQADDMGDLSYTKDTNLSGVDRFYFVASGTLDISTTTKTQAICSVYKSDTLSNLVNASATNGVGQYHKTFYFFTPAGTYADATAFAAAMDGQIICYPLATPASPIHIPNVGSLYTYLGTNNVWIDTGAITECTYPADTKLYIDGLTAPDEDMIANANIASGKYFVVNNQLYLSTAAIAAGASIVPGTNCTATNLAEALNALNT